MSDLWSKRDTISVLIYAASTLIAGWIFYRLGGDPFTWSFVIPFLFGYFTGRIVKVIEQR